MTKKIVIIGNGMVGHRFCVELIERGLAGKNRVIVFGGEPRPAYDRVQLSTWFAEESVDLTLEDEAWYRDNGIELSLGDPVIAIDRENRTVSTTSGRCQEYDKLVLATGSSAFMPPIPGMEHTGVFAYRTIDDLEAIAAYSRKVSSVAVIGGGLLGLEAAKACVDLGLETKVVEMAPRLMPRQLDDKGAAVLTEAIERLGIEVLTGVATTGIEGEDTVTGLGCRDRDVLPVEMVVVSAGIVPNDKLARDCGLEIGQRAGIVVNSAMQTSDPAIYAIGECALFEGMIYGLVAPGYEMARVTAAQFDGEVKEFTGFDMSTKLKLLGLDVASLGNPFDDNPDNRVVEVHDTVTGIYKRMVIDPSGKKLLGAILVGDAEPYGMLSLYVKGNKDLPEQPQSLIVKGGAGAGLTIDQLEDEDIICSCNNVSYGTISHAIEEQELRTVDAIQKVTKAGTGCGGCLPMVKAVLKHELAKAGIEMDNSVCGHFRYSRQDLLHIVKTKKIRTFEELLEQYGQGAGCAVCKTQVASIFASLWNEYILDHANLQDTNDRFLGNIQRNGTYSVIPRSPGGEITPEQLIVMGEIAKEFNLYTKLTGSQRVALFGVHLEDLPKVWARLGEVGLESGHAYAKGLRMVKSCVGDTWCRMGMGPSVDFAIELENRYKGMRSPHKLKAAVSGCTRECAEAMCKDFGLIATENGWNLYVGGNGGAFPRHADLLATDLDREKAIRYIDRYLMYYVRTADKLERTATWLGNLEGGVEKLKKVIIEDSLGICAELEADMERIVAGQHDEWAVTLSKPEQLERFRHFANTDGKDPVKLIGVRGQERPENWLKEYAMPEIEPVVLEGPREWVNLGCVSAIPKNSGATFQYGRHQIAVFNFSHRGEWYACQNLCPHKQEMVLSRGLLGDAAGIPQVTCPMHKKSFSLKDGKCANDEIYTIQTFEVKVDGDDLLVKLPTQEDLDRLHICKSNEPCTCFA
ncbi:nitrite reductase, NAD(P)H-dependent [Syntrophotalea carbinolica DSM 2380]|uniref:Nitrite reductase, NAD(P)H-dependent n=1 Tax=Syntrophotalea carbinolica (strain DSM 2380 / NBRC 103641 / GraBd1) TaxID=338963 RepID=Q3A0J3_SYNC1|nr:nitrite reductase large subunit NirB [Syntrophotalea carbinolica]ABA90114.1 nitrite reductase, NAD(P)H-dependent [Syntrophotalea carbinolica DSM 2380]